jgi:hypothetical protein
MLTFRAAAGNYLAAEHSSMRANTIENEPPNY